MGLLFPGLDTELAILSAAAPRFRDAGVIPVVSSPDVVALSDDKLVTAQFLERHGFLAPRTCFLSGDASGRLTFPVILKPNRGGSRRCIRQAACLGKWPHATIRDGASTIIAASW